MNPKEFAQWISRIYNTKDNELDCSHTQALLPAYVEAEFNGKQLDAPAADVETHLAQCPDCLEIYQGLYHFVELEAAGELLIAGEGIEHDLAILHQAEGSELAPLPAP